MKKFSLFLILLCLVGFSVHKYHLSLTKITFVKEKKSIQITMRCFIDDIENAINKKDAVTLELATKIEIKKADSLIENYLLEKFKIQINDTIKKAHYLGKEYEKDIVYFYLEIDSIKAIKSIRVENKVLLQNFEDQLNIIKLKMNDTKKTFSLKNGKTSKNTIF